jgi:hypothetical protein
VVFSFISSGELVISVDGGGVSLPQAVSNKSEAIIRIRVIIQDRLYDGTKTISLAGIW